MFEKITFNIVIEAEWTWLVRLLLDPSDVRRDEKGYMTVYIACIEKFLSIPICTMMQTQVVYKPHIMVSFYMYQFVNSSLAYVLRAVVHCSMRPFESCAASAALHKQKLQVLERNTDKRSSTKQTRTILSYVWSKTYSPHYLTQHWPNHQRVHARPIDMNPGPMKMCTNLVLWTANPVITACSKCKW